MTVAEIGFDAPCVACGGEGVVEVWADGINLPPSFGPCVACGGRRTVKVPRASPSSAHRTEDQRNHVSGEVYVATLRRALTAERRAAHLRAALGDIAEMSDDLAHMHARRVAREALEVEP